MPEQCPNDSACESFGHCSGTVRPFEEDELTAHLGQMAFGLSRVGPDVFEARSAGFQNEGRFMIEGRVVTGVSFDVMGETYAFVR